MKMNFVEQEVHWWALILTIEWVAFGSHLRWKKVVWSAFVTKASFGVLYLFCRCTIHSKFMFWAWKVLWFYWFCGKDAEYVILLCNILSLDWKSKQHCVSIAWLWAEINVLSGVEISSELTQENFWICSSTIGCSVIYSMPPKSRNLSWF